MASRPSSASTASKRRRAPDKSGARRRLRRDQPTPGRLVAAQPRQWRRGALSSSGSSSEVTQNAAHAIRPGEVSSLPIEGRDDRHRKTPQPTFGWRSQASWRALPPARKRTRPWIFSMPSSPLGGTVAAANRPGTTPRFSSLKILGGCRGADSPPVPTCLACESCQEDAPGAFTRAGMPGADAGFSRPAGYGAGDTAPVRR